MLPPVISGQRPGGWSSHDGAGGGDRHGAAEALAHLGDNHHAAGDPTAARRARREALRIFDELGLPDADDVRVRLLRNRVP